MTVRFGADIVSARPELLGTPTRVGLATNDAARLAANATMHTRVALREAGVPIVRLFGPEHGLGADAADGASVGDSVDARTGLPVVSLYGGQLRPSRAQVADLDLLLFDIPDVGARFYTYAWTLFHCLAACAEHGVPLVVLDRPNPMGGTLALAEGPMLEPALTSSVGGDRIPIRHALTLGELARLWQRERWPHADLRVVACEGWSRHMTWPDTGLAWVPPSPAMPAWESALCYPGTGLFEGTNVSVGRGTDAPFQRIGAPWLDADAVARRVNAAAPRGATLEPHHFVPTSAPYAGVPCRGVRIVVTDVTSFRPVALGLQLLATVIATHRATFAWAPYPTTVNPSGDGHFDRLVARADVRAQLDAHAGAIDGAQLATWTTTEDWADRVGPVLRYPDRG